MDLGCRCVKAAAFGDRNEGAQVAQVQIHVRHASIQRNFAIHMLTPLRHDCAPHRHPAGI
jgi:hypothetical protein